MRREYTHIPTPTNKKKKRKKEVKVDKASTTKGHIYLLKFTLKSKHELLRKANRNELSYLFLFLVSLFLFFTFFFGITYSSCY